MAGSLVVPMVSVASLSFIVSRRNWLSVASSEGIESAYSPGAVTLIIDAWRLEEVLMNPVDL